MKIYISRQEYDEGLVEIFWAETNEPISEEVIKTNLPMPYNWSGSWLLDNGDVIKLEPEDIPTSSYWVVKETERGTTRVRFTISAEGMLGEKKLMKRLDTSFSGR